MNKTLVNFFIAILTLSTIQAMESERLLESTLEISNYLDLLPHEIQEEVFIQMIKHLIKQDVSIINQNLSEEKDFSVTEEFEAKLSALKKIIKSIEDLYKIKQFQDIENSYQITKLIIDLLDKSISSLIFRCQLLDLPIKCALIMGTPNAIRWLKNETSKERLNNILFDELSQIDSNGDPICNYENIKLLVEGGANVNAKSNTWPESPLWYAIVNNAKDIVQLFINNHADVNAISSWGHTLLMEAIDRNCIQIVKLLIENGANVNAITENGSTALKKAKCLKAWASEAKKQRFVEKAKLSPHQAKGLATTADKEEIINLLKNAGASDK